MRLVPLLVLLLAGCASAPAPDEIPSPTDPPQPTPIGAPPGSPTAPPRATLPWLSPEGAARIDPLLNLTVRQLTSDPADDDVFYQEPRSFGGAARDLFLFRSARGDGQHRLHLVNLTSGAIARLRDDTSFGWSPTWTLDGNTVIVGHDRALLLIDAATGETRTIALPTDAWITFPHVSPDGSRVLFVEEARGAGEATHLALGMARLDGSAYERLYALDRQTEFFLDHPVWLDDATVAFLTRGEGRDFRSGFNRPYVLDLGTRAIQRLPHECSHYDPNPRASLLLCGQEGYVLEKRGTKVFTYAGIHGHAAWAPDGERFLATADPVPVPEGEPHHGTIALLRMGSEARVDLVRHGSAYDSVAHDQPDAQWSPDGRWIVWTARGDLWAVEAPLK